MGPVGPVGPFEVFEVVFDVVLPVVPTGGAGGVTLGVTGVLVVPVVVRSPVLDVAGLAAPLFLSAPHALAANATVKASAHDGRLEADNEMVRKAMRQA